MNKRGIIARTTAGALGGLLLIGGAGAAIADELDNDSVEVSVNIEALPPVGALTLSVASNSTTLTESGSTADIRQFTGELPTVTVTDDREDVPADTFWYVTGQSSEFSADGVASLGPEHLGWTPILTSDDSDGQVAEGAPVDTILDQGPDAVGLVGEELLAIAPNLAGGELPNGEWSAKANLFLKTPAEVAPGAYKATITLTLWEDAI
ncbi:hypothetical protein [Microbacterium sp. BK668]|uniref:hypothetical protein n=1 Tax=Microbacterium sp. BK668 TaxID=2512118 RepID=UPI00105F021C|nr:hypothetical protein [Microbacterium sp. BK668]TDN91732.1 hypothetical protein EV279_1236 [Microbacterium sp. BK668]